MGTHEGYPFYTIGQRRGLGISHSEPLYVIHIDPDSNVITLGTRDELHAHELVARNINLIKYPDLRDERAAVGKIRYKDGGAPALVRQTGDDELRVAFTEPRTAITPGQSVVLYEDDDVLAGGWIRDVEDEDPAKMAIELTVLGSS
jgi:tRNA-specific 2-thiouridylase